MKKRFSGLFLCLILSVSCGGQFSEIQRFSIYKETLTVGIMSDLQIPENAADDNLYVANTKKALEYFRSQNIDILINAGDLTDLSANSSYDPYSQLLQTVFADMGKIQQVMYNLIDNAIKFSHPDSTIYIQVSDRYEKIFISVKDTGIGIPKDSIKKIWERFYKTDLSRGKDKKGTGLGLSIVKEIIQAHGENIDVISTEGVGTEFIFSLPKSSSL